MIRENIITAFREDILEGNAQRGHMELGNKKKGDHYYIMVLYFWPSTIRQELEEEICEEITDRCRNNKVINNR